jgi:hypothetical protein
MRSRRSWGCCRSEKDDLNVRFEQPLLFSRNLHRYAAALPNPLALAGFHRRVFGDRLDLLAARYLKDPTFFWKICDSNNSPAPDALAGADLVGIPTGPNT